MTVLSFAEIAAKYAEDRTGRRTSRITGNVDEQVEFVPTRICESEDPDSQVAFGVFGHLFDDESKTGFVNVFVDQLVLEGGHMTTRELVKAHMDENLAMTARMGKTPGQLKLIKGLRFER
tara:strand:- start:52 stop:411 length:360 start_codon:yes stop_codon:yes gene_type:complete